MLVVEAGRRTMFDTIIFYYIYGHFQPDQFHTCMDYVRLLSRHTSVLNYIIYKNPRIEVKHLDKEIPYIFTKIYYVLEFRTVFKA